MDMKYLLAALLASGIAYAFSGQDEQLQAERRRAQAEEAAKQAQQQAESAAKQIALLTKQRQADQIKRQADEAHVSKEAAWVKAYRPAAGCESTATVQCANDHMRQRAEFEASWARRP